MNYEKLNTWSKASGKHSWTACSDGDNTFFVPRPRIIRYEDSWNVMAHGKKSVPFEQWDDARAFALCAFHCPEMLTAVSK